MEPMPEEQGDLDRLRAALERGAADEVRQQVAALYPAEIARLLESLPTDEREILWGQVPGEVQGEVLVELNDEVREGLVAAMNPQALVAATAGMEIDDLADFVPDLPGTVIGQVLESLSSRDRERLEAALSYPEDTAGGLMNPETVTVRPDVTVDVVLRYLRMRGELPDQSDGVYVVDEDDRYRGVLSFARLLTAQPETGVGALMDPSIEPIPATLGAAAVAREFQDRDLIAAPVVDAEGRLLGQVTVDDVVDVIQERADQEMLSMAGLDQEDDLFAPVITSSARRAVWLVLHLSLAFVTASVINLFQDTIGRVVLLAVLMPLVATMGGIAGSQTLTLMIRGLALGRIRLSNALPLLSRELAVGAVNAVLAAAVAGAVTVGFFGDWHVAAVIAAALAFNLVLAVAVGFSVPLLLRRFGVDPALAGSVVLITLTDLVGFVAILGLGSWFLA